MEVSDQQVKVSSQQQRVLKLLFKFRFISAQLLAQVMGISRPGVYQALEPLVKSGFVVKVYDDTFRIDRKPAYYYLSTDGVTTVRGIMGVKESVVHTLYKNDVVSEDFINHCLIVARCYVSIAKTLPPDTDIFTRSEINRYSQFPKNKPDLYIRTPEGDEAIVVVAHDKPLYIVRKRFEEIISHSEDGEWGGEYPRIGFILRHSSDRNSFAFTSRKKLDDMGMDENELEVLVSDIESLNTDNGQMWINAFKPKILQRLIE